MYESTEEAQLRLQNCVFLYGDDVVLCREVMGPNNDIRLRLLKFPEEVWMEDDIKLSDPKLQYKTLNLGYVDLGHYATYLKRIPVRRYKQGLCRENVNLSPGPSGGRPDWAATLKSKGFREMLHNQYPTISEAYKRLKEDEDVYSVAIHRKFAIARDKFRGDFVLNYRGQRVGFGDGAFVLPDEFQYLREISMKAGIATKGRMAA